MQKHQKKITHDADSDDEVHENREEVTSTVDDAQQSLVDDNEDKVEEHKYLKDEELVLVDWTWKGYLTWYLYGYIAPKSNRLSIFISGV